MISAIVRGADQVARRLERAGREMPSAVERGVKLSSLLVHRELTIQMGGTGPSDPFLGRMGAAPPKLGVRTGATRRRLSPGGKVFKIAGQYVSAVGSPDSYVRAHEDGTTITGNPYLRIPLAAAQTGAGQDRYVGMSVRGVPDLFVIKSKAGNLLLARKRGKDGLDILYVLKRQVRLPARGMFKAVTARTRPAIEKLLGQQVGVEVRRANG